MSKGFIKSFPCVWHMSGFMMSRKVSMLLLAATIIHCYMVESLSFDEKKDKSLSFNEKMDKILSSPSRHGEKVAPWDPHKISRIRRNVDELESDSAYSDSNGFFFYDDYGRGKTKCQNFTNDDLRKLSIELYKGPVCDIIDARGNADRMRDLENCTVVNGFVHLVFMHNLTKADLQKYRFPKLRLITHYLLVFRMYNLRSLRDMFPNLAVIDGQELFKDYSLVVYENPHLQEIGLKNLRLINRGSVRIQKNNNLCYLNRVNWNWLSSYTKHGGFAKNVIADNGDVAECVDRCSDDKSCEVEGQEYCWGLGLCQKRKPCLERAQSSIGCLAEECPNKCHACRETVSGPRCDCDPQCLAGCTKKNDPTQCLACRNKYFNNTCVEECPDGMYLIHDWLCITKEECQRLDWHFHEDVCKLQCPSGYQVVVRDCMNICEKCESDCGKVCLGDQLVTDHYDLVKVETCQEIQGTLTISINGGSEFVKELDEAFKDLKRIGGLVVRSSHPLVSLTFLRKVNLITGESMRDNGYSVYVLGNQNLKQLWDFNKSNLTIAKGKAFFHFNPHLCMQEIDKVKELTKPVEDDKDISELTNGDRAVCEIDIIKILDVHMFPKASENEQVVKIQWENAEIKDFRTLIGYQVLYKESPHMDAKKLQGVDACGHTSWTIVDKPKEENYSFSAPDLSALNMTNASEPIALPFGPRESGSTYKLLTGLKAFTQYAYYVHAYTTSTATKGAESVIQYFITKPAVPSSPQALRADAATTSGITVTWQPPTKPNGIITHYIVVWRRQTEEDLARVRSVDSCKGISSAPLTPVVPETPAPKPDDGKDTTSDKGTETGEGQCPCDCDQISDEKEKLAIDSAEFENFLQDHIFPSIQDLPYADSEYFYLDEDDSDLYTNDSAYDYGGDRSKRSLWNTRLRRSLVTDSAPTGNTTLPPPTGTTGQVGDSNATSVAPETPPTVSHDKEYVWKRMVVNTTQARISGLHHFSEYDIMVYACNHASDPRSKTDLTFKVQSRENEGYGSNYTKCSIEAITSKRTAKNDSVDVIPHGSVNVTTRKEQNSKGKLEAVTELVWRMPVDPNAYIRTFTISVTPTESGNLDHGRNFCVHVNSSVKDVMSFSIRSNTDLPPGEYTAKVRPVSLAGEGRWTKAVSFEMPNMNKSNVSTILAIVLAVLVGMGLVCVGLVIYLCKTRKKAPDPHMLYTDWNPEYSHFVYIPDEYEIDLENLTILEEIGHGNFGKVFAGLAKNVVRGQVETKVAIKKLHENAAPSRRLEFLKEASLMKAFNAAHVVRLLGVISKTVDPMVIMEFMEKGDLKSHLRSRREGSDENTQDLPAPTVEEKLQMAAEIADGMAYLADNKFVHRDLAARNCLVAADGTVKIGDFGLTRDIYETDYYRKESRGFLPIRWMAPESLKDGIFDSRSDVWSYGVVLWELATLAEQPYQGQQHDEVTRFVIDGGYMERPRDCPKRLYDLMTTCWQYNPNMRPEFLEIVQELYSEVNAEFREVCFYAVNDSNEDQEVQLVLPDHSSSADHYLGNDIHAPFQAAQALREDEAWHSADPSVRYVKSGSGRPGGLMLDPSHAESDEKRALLQQDPDQLSPFNGEGSCHQSEDNRSPNTTSTMALSPPSTGDSQDVTRRRRYSSDSQYENDYDDHEAPDYPQRDPIANNKNPKSGALDPLISYTHLNGGHKSKKPSNLDLDLESGVEEGNWANSSTTSTSNPSTPTESQAMLGSGRNEHKEGNNKLFQMLRPPGPTSSSC